MLLAFGSTLTLTLIKLWQIMAWEVEGSIFLWLYWGMQNTRCMSGVCLSLNTREIGPVDIMVRNVLSQLCTLNSHRRWLLKVRLSLFTQFDLLQLNFKDQCCICRDSSWYPLSPVTQRGGNDQKTLAPLGHAYHPLVPSLAVNIKFKKWIVFEVSDFN